MDFELVMLRLFHIVFGVIWAGSAVFIAGILEPRLRKLGPTVMQPVMGALMPILTPVMLLSATITIAFGIILSLRLRWGNLDTFFDTGWGVAILIGFIVSILAFGTGLTTSITGKRLMRLGASIQGRPPTPEEGALLGKLSARLTLLSRSTAVLTVIATGSMASARFI
jgi:uncharacterized membrane protein